MHRAAAIFTITTLAAAALSACSQSHPQSAAISPPPFYVPATLILQSPETHPAPANAASPLAFQVLAAADYETSFFPRGQKFAYGDIPLQQYNSYSILTYDVQRIGSPFGPGYRYVWDVKSGVNIR